MNVQLKTSAKFKHKFQNLGVKCNACRLDRCLERGMDVGLMKFPSSALANRSKIIEFVKRRSKKVKLHKTIVSIKQENNNRNNANSSKVCNPSNLAEDGKI